MSVWPEVPLGSILEPGRAISYGIVQPGSHDEAGVPIVRVHAVRNCSIDPSNPLRVARDIEAQYCRTRLRGGELLLTLVGTVGEAAEVSQEMAGWNVARAIGVIPVRKDIGARWVRYVLGTTRVRQAIDSWCNTTVQTTLNLKDVARIPIVLPPDSERARILEVLGPLDDALVLNRHMDETLEAMAQALFKSWFVDFDPVRAKAEGRRPFGMDADTATLFPEHMAEQDGRAAPKGWSWVPASEQFNITMGQSPPGNTYNEQGEGLPFFQGRADFGSRFPSNRVYCTAPTRFADDGDTLVSVRAPVGDINMALERCAIGRGVAAVRHVSSDSSFTYYSMWNLRDEFRAFEAEGTVFGSINKKDFHALQVVAAPKPVLERFASVCNPLDARIRHGELESRTLAKLRDLLLPKLLSGELRVKDAEKAVSAVV